MVLSKSKSVMMSICVFRAAICGPTFSARFNSSAVVVTSAEAMRLVFFLRAISKIFLALEWLVSFNFSS